MNAAVSGKAEEREREELMGAWHESECCCGYCGTLVPRSMYWFRVPIVCCV